MKPEEFDALRKEAGELFKSQTGSQPKVSLDAIFVALVNTRTIKVRKAKPQTPEEPIPKWFHDTYSKVRKAGEEITVGRFLMLAGEWPATRENSLRVAKWLRAEGVKEKKVGGNLIFYFK